MRAVDAHGFGGGFTLGVVQSGFELVGKMSRSVGFGVYNTLANRHLLGQGWDSIASEPELWEKQDAELVFGNPPCSGFSTLSSAHFRGEDSPINDYMWELINYAGRVAPPVVAWESVQTTFRQGLGLMRRLHARLEKVSGHEYHLTHVLHNNLSHGGVSMRKRYFWVASRVPFGVGPGRATREGGYAPLTSVPTFRDMLTDLEPLGLTMAPQPYRGLQESRMLVTSEWARREVHNPAGTVDGHDVYHPKGPNRTTEAVQREVWNAGEGLADVLRRYYQHNGELWQSWRYESRSADGKGGTKEQRLIDTDFNMGHSQPYRWHADRPANVITGSAVHSVVHPWLPRLITYREAARVQGFPDDWLVWPVRNAPDLGPGWGKGVPVQAARWLGHWVSESLEGRPGELQGVPLERYRKDIFTKFGEHPRETVVDTTYAFRQLSPGGSTKVDAYPPGSLVRA